MATSTPWGAAQDKQIYAPGIISYSTSSHGGFHLSKTRQKEMPAALVNPDGWYEEDCEWCKVVIGFSQYFETKKLSQAYDTLKNWDYKTYEKFTGLALNPGESHSKDQVLFEETHKNDWVVISALTNKDDRSLVDVTATLGGQRKWNGKKRQYIVTAADYEKRSYFGFVITDQTKITA